MHLVYLIQKYSLLFDVLALDLLKWEPLFSSRFDRHIDRSKRPPSTCNHTAANMAPTHECTANDGWGMPRNVTVDGEYGAYYPSCGWHDDLITLEDLKDVNIVLNQTKCDLHLIQKHATEVKSL